MRMWKNSEKISNSLAFKITDTRSKELHTYPLCIRLKVYKIPLRVKVALCAVLVISNDPHPIYNKRNTNPDIIKVRVRENTIKQ